MIRDCFIYLSQIGGKYCEFACPVCGQNAGKFKMTANTGWCDSCNETFINFDAVQIMPVRPGMQHPDMIGWVEWN